MKHFFPALVIFALPLDYEKDAVNDFSLESAVGIIHFAVEHLKSSLGWVVKLGRCLVGMRKEVYQYFFDLIVLGHCESFHKIFDPNFSMVLNILPNQFIQIFADNKSLIANAIDDTGHQNHIVLFLFAVLGIENNLDYLLGNAKQLNALVNQAFLEEWCEFLNLIKFPVFILLKLLQKLLGVGNLVEYLELNFRNFVNFIEHEVNGGLILHFHLCCFLNADELGTGSIVVVLVFVILDNAID